ncbi:MAG TPA: alpha-amylase family glycosyl hydrolase [Opitutaceae bacterium]|nr:alpha-amylase family glycosyl hydrolase [Opitutaceae bacterium]
MTARRPTIAQAWLETPDSGVIELTRDWFGKTPPPVFLGSPPRPFRSLRPVPAVFYAEESGYFVSNRQELWFLLEPERFPWIDPQHAQLYVAGDFNGWSQAIGRLEWQLKLEDFGGQLVFVLRKPADALLAGGRQRFKFVTAEQQWLPVSSIAPNAVRDEQGNVNYSIDPDRTGQHRFAFETVLPLDLSENLVVLWSDPAGEQKVPLRPDGFFFRLRSELRLGATVEGDETVFRLFAPRARRVRLKLLEKRDRPEDAAFFPLERGADGVWELRLDRELSGWFYWFLVEGPASVFGHFDRQFPILDPYARAAVDRLGPGIVLADSAFPRPEPFRTPQWQDLVIAEAHVRDLVAQAPLALGPKERLGFAGLAKWVEQPDFYLKRLGVNCVELQPVQEFDNRTPEEYHWGYMPVNWFAPASAYASEPEKASQVAEFRELVAAFHRQGMAVVLDVVYNHQGEPSHLMFVDKHYYFDDSADGSLTNWSGCGNDYRAGSEMALRLIIDSCAHFIRAYGVDGFRFDLADLIGLEPLKRIETALKKVKSDVILIAEPWSFRGHLAGALSETGWASWNDGYRKFLPSYVRGEGSREGFEYFLKGSPWFFAKWPAQTVNYTESHDDRTWLDVITENADGNGHTPTANDRRRTHLMCAVLMSSVGIPMLAAGQDFLRSKHGVNNTYLRGDLNALDYRRIFRFPTTHRYFADWIRFRQSERGRLLRQFSRPSEGFFQFRFAPDSTAAAVVYNADLSQGRTRLMVAFNPHAHEVTIPLAELSPAAWRQLADHEHFFVRHDVEPALPLDGELFLPPFGVGLWLAE